METVTRGSQHRSAAGDTVLECRGLRKAFGANIALDRIDLAIRAGEIHALVGQNGAGKSTLVKILTGVYRATSGELLVDGKPVRIGSPQDAEAGGIVIVHQDQQLVEQFDVTRNIFLGQEDVRNGLLDFGSMRRRAEELLRRVGATFSPNELVRELSVAERALVSIASALLRRPRVLILDEPTASLSNEEADRLFDIVRALRDQGVTIVLHSNGTGCGRSAGPRQSCAGRVPPRGSSLGSKDIPSDCST
jgi:ribose transport system ATP-binding protein